MRRILFCLLVIAGPLVGVAQAADIYVDNVGGDDTLDGTSPERPAGFIGPTRTIAKALRVAGPGDHIHLRRNPEPYRESVTLFGLRNSGLNAQYPLIIQGNGSTLDGSAPIDRQVWNHVKGDLYRFAPSRLTYQQLFMNGRPVSRKDGNSRVTAIPELDAKQWFLSESWIYFRTEPDHLPADYELRCAQLPVGISLYQVHDVAILDLVLQGFQQDGIKVHDVTHNVLLGRLNCRGNGRSGVAVANASEADLSECVIGDNGNAQLLLEGESDTHVSSCEIFENSAPRFVRHGGRLTVDGETLKPEK